MILKFADEAPTRLTDAVRSIPSLLRYRPTRYVTAAGFVIAEYLRRMPVGPNAHSFFNQSTDADGSLHWLLSARIVSLADTLVNLRNQPGFAELCRRLSGKDLRAAYFEATAARFFMARDFSILMRKEEGARGRDFDFEAVSHNCTVNVEVTALTADSFSNRTIVNALNRKRGQLPDSHPAVIVCALPLEWKLAESQINGDLAETTRQFLKDTRRISYVDYIIEEAHDIGERQGILGQSSFNIPNERPRHYSAKLRRRMSRPLMASRRQSEVSQHEGKTISSEFIDWVDNILDE